MPLSPNVVPNATAPFPRSLPRSPFAAWTPLSILQNEPLLLTVDADGHGVVDALPERLVLGLADEHAAVVLRRDVHLQQADRHVPAVVASLEEDSNHVVMKRFFTWIKLAPIQSVSLR